MSEHEKKLFFSAELSMIEQVRKRKNTDSLIIEQVYSQMSKSDLQVVNYNMHRSRKKKSSKNAKKSAYV